MTIWIYVRNKGQYHPLPDTCFSRSKCQSPAENETLITSAKMLLLRWSSDHRNENAYTESAHNDSERKCLQNCVHQCEIDIDIQTYEIKLTWWSREIAVLFDRSCVWKTFPDRDRFTTSTLPPPNSIMREVFSQRWLKHFHNCTCVKRRCLDILLKKKTINDTTIRYDRANWSVALWTMLWASNIFQQSQALKSVDSLRMYDVLKFSRFGKTYVCLNLNLSSCLTTFWQTLQDSFSAVSNPNFASKYSLE